MSLGEPAAGSVTTEELAHVLSETSSHPADRIPILFSGGYPAFFEQLQRSLIAMPPEMTRRPSVEWFLDNFYLIVATSRQSGKDLPRGFYRDLPVAAGKNGNVPRAYRLAEHLVRTASRAPDRATFETHLADFQRITPLTIAELWAFPTLVRAVCLQRIAEALAPIASLKLPTSPTGVETTEASSLDADEVVAIAVRTLIALKNISWRKVFEHTSLVHQELRRDPAGVYDHVDFETADQCRRQVETFARRARCDEVTVAHAVVRAAAKSLALTGHVVERRSHVGYYLVDDGCREIETALGIRTSAVERFARWLRAHATGVYLSAVVFATIGVLSVLFALVQAHRSPWILVLLGGALAFVPASTFAIAWVQWIIMGFVKPKRLSRLALEAGIKNDLKTIVVIPTLLGDLDEVHQLVKQLEQHYLANPDPNLQFALLADYTDAETQHAAPDAELLTRAREGILLLNGRHGKSDVGPFHLLVRERRWNASEGVFMGWERKRGKLEEFNRLLAGWTKTSYSVHVGDPNGLLGVRFVITLDSDTELPRDGARNLVAVLAHPLNRAEFHGARVVAGYSVLQPRLDINPDASHRSRFASIFSGDTGLDIYSRAVSDVYQDFFGAGIYVGKGIYDVDAFRRALEGRVPDNTLLSHDLFEGICGRAGLVTDIVLYEDYPPTYLAYARRLHRWIRGDWQLLPWLGFRVPGREGARIPNPFTHIDRWKVLDNLRRSLHPLTLFLLLVSGWTWLPGSGWLWTGVAITLSSGHLLTAIASYLRAVVRRPLRVAATGLTDLSNDILRWTVAWAFLPHEAAVISDAILRTIVRVFFIRRGLLEWTTAAHTARTFSRREQLATWQEMAVGPVSAVLVMGIVLVLDPVMLAGVAPFAALWFLSPQLAWWLARPRATESEVLQERERSQLRLLARRIWLFFETFVGPEDHWLPPDNVQLHPLKIAHRTSPTNIGLYMASAATAYDLGHLMRTEFCVRIRSALRTLDQLERYRGQLLNWYDTRSLEPLSPRYVSTVDNGNFIASLIVVREACSEHATGSILDSALWAGLLDVTTLTSQAVLELAHHRGQANVGAKQLNTTFTKMISIIRKVRDRPCEWPPALAKLEQHIDLVSENLREMVSGLDSGHTSMAHEALSWLDVLSRHVRSLARDLTSFADWFFKLCDAPQILLENADLRDAHDDLILSCRRFSLDELAVIRPDVLNALDRFVTELDLPEVVSFRDSVLVRFDKAAIEADQAVADLLDVAASCQTEIDRADFEFLYDQEAHQLFIGYDVSNARPDFHHYDLLASEARLASLIAIAFGHAPVKHWFHLGRPLSRIAGHAALLSWSGTMFEYLMPLLFTQSFPKTLLGRSTRAAVNRQIRYAKKLRIPWGISESGFFSVDKDGNYQYRAFGVPGLGLKRGLADDVVVAPYASLLALSIRPKAVLDNLRALEKFDVHQVYGPLEAIDFTPGRLKGRKAQVLQSYMAHHQGMVLLALGNVLLAGRTTARFHGDPRIQTVVHLLQEKPPTERPAPAFEETASQGGQQGWLRPTLEPWTPSPTVADPQAHLLSNGRLSLRSDAFGRGDLWFGEVSLRPWERGQEIGGFCLYLLTDHDQHRVVLLAGGFGSEAVDDRRVTYWPHKIETLIRTGSIVVRQTVLIATDGDVEVRSVAIKNESQSSTEVCLTSYSDLALQFAREHHRHPAFSRLFLETRFHAPTRLLVCRRRPRSPTDRWPVVAQTVVADADVEVSWETSRSKFVGRGRSLLNAESAQHSDPLEGISGHVLDPCFAQRIRLTLGPGEERSLTWLTAAASDEVEARRAIDRYTDVSGLAATDGRAERAAADLAFELGMTSTDARAYQRLLSRVIHRTARPAGRRRVNRRTLWSHGVSGDYPILLVHRHEESSTLGERLLRAHALWSRQGLRVDVVFLLHEAPSYLDETKSQIRRLGESLGLAEGGGGMAVVPVSSLSTDELEAWEGAADAVLDTDAGELEFQVETVLEPEDMPAFAPAFAIERGPKTEPLRRPEHLQFDNGLGGFDQDRREYVIYLNSGQQTPAPWCNVLANPQFGCIVSERGLGCTWAVNAGENRLTPWWNDPIEDPPSEAMYIRDEETGEVWTPTPGPRGAPSSYEVAHGLGTTRWRHHSHGLAHHLRILVDPDQPLKLIELSVQNLWDTPRRLTITYYVPWVLGARRAQDGCFAQPRFDPDARAIFVANGWNLEIPEQLAFVATDRPVHGFTTDGVEFLGKGGIHNPDALHRWGLSNREYAGPEPCAALQVHVDLPARGTHSFHFALGWGQEPAAARKLAIEAIRSGIVEETAERLKERWHGLLGAVQVETPEPATDLMLNTWSLYQAISSRIFARTGFYQSSGAIGFRDQLQDVMALCYSAPALMRAHILDCAKHQFESGDVLHWWHPPSGRGVRTRCSDDFLWLPFVVAHYVRTTGDVAVLDERISFLSGPELSAQEVERYDLFTVSSASGSLMDHCLRAIWRASPRGEHGLPRMGSGDWNDGMNLVRGESVWLGWFLYSTASQLAELCDRTDRTTEARDLRAQCVALKTAIEATWDGAWYVRAFYEDGSPLGSHRQKEASIDSIAQSWAVLSGAADVQRASVAMDSAVERLVDDDAQLIRLLWPPFDTSRQQPGYIKGYPRGIRENGAQYTHAATWLIWALAELGRGDEAENLFRMVNPITHALTTDRAARYRTEPYVLAGDVYSVEPHRGTGGWTWYTGSAAWYYRLGIEAILGLRIEWPYLRISPRIPREWPGYRVTLRLGASIFEIEVDNPGDDYDAIVHMTLDGDPVEHGRVDIQHQEGHHRLRVVLGNKSIRHTGDHSARKA